MSGKSIKFGDKKSTKSFYKNKKLFKMEDIDINKILVPKKEPYGENSFKYFIGYNDDDGIRSLCIKLPEMVGYVKHFKNNNEDIKRTSFKVSDKKLLKNYNKMWEKISNLLNKEFDSEPVYGNNDKYIWPRIKLYGDKINTNFQGKKMPKENESYKCLSLIMLETVIKGRNKKYYPKTPLEECKYEIKKKKIENYISDGFDSNSSDESDNE